MRVLCDTEPCSSLEQTDVSEERTASIFKAMKLFHLQNSEL
jgi:hypothetical protein